MIRLVVVLALLAAACSGRPSASPAPTTVVAASVATSTSAPTPTTTTSSTTTTRPRPSITAAGSTAATTATTATAARPPTLAEQLRRTVATFAARQPVPFSIEVVDLRTAALASHLADREVWSASLYKLFVARELLRRVYAGELARDAPADDGQGRTVGQCMRAMIVVSDDACGVAGLRIVGYEALDPTLARDGYVGTHLGSPQRTTAADVTTFFLRAHDGTLLGPGGEAPTAELWELLVGQQVDDRLPQGLPPTTPIAHKTGDRTGWAHDVGIVTAPKGEFLIAVLSGPWPAPCCHAEDPGPLEHQAFGAIAELGREVYALYR